MKSLILGFLPEATESGISNPSPLLQRLVRLFPPWSVPVDFVISGAITLLNCEEDVRIRLDCKIIGRAIVVSTPPHQQEGQARPPFGKVVQKLGQDHHQQPGQEITFQHLRINTEDLLTKLREQLQANDMCQFCKSTVFWGKTHTHRRT